MFNVRTPLAPRSLAVALAGLALTAPTALARPFEAPAPPPVKHANVYVPPTLAQAAVGQPKTTDLRSPDAKDAAARAANGYVHGTTYAPAKPVEGNPALAISKLTPEQIASAFGHAPTPPVSHPATVTSHVKASDDGFDWGSAGIGAGTIGGLALLGLGGFGVAYRSRVRLAR
jgi:hypothetical protein